MALPRPQFALVSIELGLIARFSTRDGVMWVQARADRQLVAAARVGPPHRRLRLRRCGSPGPHAGEFVLTMGGFHPDFHRDGYPQVPRLGFRWQVSDYISIKGENYFALTSEALMAGGALEASAKFGPAWANVAFGANVDRLFRSVPLRGARSMRGSRAGVTIDLWLGEITISVASGRKHRRHRSGVSTASATSKSARSI